jgi:ribosomal protein S18 acetylase RimI-like enzyme
MNLDLESKKVRQLGKNEQIPYDLLLLADESMEAINKYIYDSDIYILEIENKILAVYVLQLLKKDEIEIKNIAVDKDYQGQGIGKFLLRDATNKAKEQGFKTMLIGTSNASFKQLYIYQKSGFEIYDIKENFIINNYPKPIYENGLLLKHMIMLRKTIA